MDTCEATKESEIEKAKAQVAEEWNNKLLAKVEKAKSDVKNECDARIDKIDKKMLEKEKKIDKL